MLQSGVSLKSILLWAVSPMLAVLQHPMKWHPCRADFTLKPLVWNRLSGQRYFRLYTACHYICCHSSWQHVLKITFYSKMSYSFFMYYKWIMMVYEEYIQFRSGYIYEDPCITIFLYVNLFWLYRKWVDVMDGCTNSYQ